MPIDIKQKKVINSAIQIGILIFIAIFFYQKIKDEELRLSLGVLIPSIQKDLFLWSVVLLMMPLNWLLESLKWKMLCRPLFDISLVSAIKGVVAGLSVSFITPHGWGDYFGRIMVLRDQERERLVGALFFGKMAQLFVTVVAGVFGLVMYFEVWPYLYAWYIFTFLVVALLISFNKSIYRILRPYLSRIRKYFSIIKEYNGKAILTVLMISFIRYAVFALQFVLIMKLLGVNLDFLVIFGGITWIFLVKSIMPSFNFLSDLGIREVSAIMFFESYLSEVSPVVAATLLIWVINIFLPAVIGTLFVFSIKAFR